MVTIGPGIPEKSFENIDDGQPRMESVYPIGSPQAFGLREQKIGRGCGCGNNSLKDLSSILCAFNAHKCALGKIVPRLAKPSPQFKK